MTCWNCSCTSVGSGEVNVHLTLIIRPGRLKLLCLHSVSSMVVLATAFNYA